MDDLRGQVRLAHILEARARIGHDVHRTPLLSSRLLGEMAGGTVYLKCENLQRTGSFKSRGALNALMFLTDEQRARGVCAYSSGNHGQAVAWAARHVGTTAVVFMPVTAPRGKIDAAEAYHAVVRLVGTTSVDRQEAAEEFAAEAGMAVVPPFDDARVIEGQGTCGLEIVEDLDAVDFVVVPVGGGGLLAGVSVAVTESRPSASIIGVEPVGSDCLGRALAEGRAVTIPTPTTIADGLRSLQVGELPLAIARRRLAATKVVDDHSIMEAMRFLLTRARLVVEPSGAVAVAALMSGAVPLAGRTAVVILSGGNVAPELLSEALQS